MELKVSHEDGYVLAATEGPIDDSVGNCFKELLHPLVGQRGTRLVLDLSQSKFINSTGIGQLVLLVTHANTAGSHIVLAACSPFVAVVMETTKLNTFFRIADSVPEAIQTVLDQ